MLFLFKMKRGSLILYHIGCFYYLALWNKKRKMTNSKLIYIEDDQILGNLITQALVGNDSSEESLNNVISQFRKKFRSTNTFISVHIPVLDTNWIPDGQPNREKPNPIQPLPANNFYIIHHSPNTIRDIGSTSWYIYFPMKANERNIVTVSQKRVLPK